MAGKVFETIFKIGAKYTGKPAFAAVNRDIDRTQRNAKMSAAMIGGLRTAYAGMFTAISAGATIAASAIGVIGFKAFQAAKDVRKSHDIVRQANERLVQQGRLRAGDLEKQTQETIALAEAMEQAGGIDAEVLMEGFAELSKSMGSERIQDMSKGLQDWLITVHKGAPTNEQIIEDMRKINEAVFKGKFKGLQDLGISKEDVKALSEIETVQGRRLKIQKLLSKETGATAAWLKTDAGATYRLQRATESWMEKAGKPMAAVSRRMTEALINLTVAMHPVADAIAKQLEPRLEELVKWIDKNKESIATFSSEAVNLMWWLNDEFWKMSEASKNFFQPIVQNTIKEFNFLKDALSPVVRTTVDNTIKEWNNLQNGWEAAKKGLGEFPSFFKGKWDETVAVINLSNEELVGLYDKLPNQIKDALAPVGKIIEDAFRPALNWVIDKSQQLAQEFDKIPAKDAIPRGTAGGPGTSAEDISPPLPEGDGIDLTEPNPLVPDVPAPTTPGASGPGTSMVPAGSKLKDTIRAMNMKERMGGSGGTNVANINPTINVHGVAPGREQVAAQSVAKAIRDPIRAGIADLKKMQNYESRLGYV